MNCACFGLEDLPDEILLIILKYLTNIEVLYSLMNINTRLNAVVSDSIFTSRLTFLKCLFKVRKSLQSLSPTILNKVLKILPEICHNIKRIDIQSLDLSLVLFQNYPNLTELGLYNVHIEEMKQFFTSKLLNFSLLQLRSI